jgi:hypothetical protein
LGFEEGGGVLWIAEAHRKGFVVRLVKAVSIGAGRSTEASRSNLCGNLWCGGSLFGDGSGTSFT